MVTDFLGACFRYVMHGSPLRVGGCDEPGHGEGARFHQRKAERAAPATAMSSADQLRPQMPEMRLNAMRSRAK